MNKTKAKRRGFSLLELLAVISIMALLTTMAVTSYFSSIRGMARRSAVKQIVNTLTLARQRACMDSARYSVVFFNEITGSANTDVTPSYVVSKEIGRLTYISGSTFIDEFTPLDRIFGVGKEISSYRGSLRLYNLTQGKWSQVFPWAIAHPMTISSGTKSTTRYNMNLYALKKNPNLTNLNEAQWTVGDAYGVEAAPIRALPKGFEFTQLQSSVNQAIAITFYPDGRAKWSTGSKISLLEKNPPQKGIDIEVTDAGVVQYSETWK